MQRKELIRQIAIATERCQYLHQSYGLQIKLCNSAKSVDSDFVKLSSLKREWHDATIENTRLESILSNLYNKNGKGTI
jgi:hypothetical protein